MNINIYKVLMISVHFMLFSYNRRKDIQDKIDTLTLIC